MNILFLDQFSELGGAQRCLLDLLPAVQDRGWRASVALPGDGPLVDLLRKRGIPVHGIPCGPYQSGGKGIGDLFRFGGDVRDQVRVLRAIDVDLVYVNGPRLLAAAAIVFGRRIPVLFHAHSRIPAGPSVWIARWSLRRSQATVAACAAAVTPPGSNSVHLIANGTPDMGFRTRDFLRPRIGMIGRITPEKGQAEFLQAAAAIAGKAPNLSFVICGAPIFPSGDYHEEVKKLAAGIPVEFLGWRDDVAAVLAEMDLLVIASKTEGMPRVLIEAFSAGVPVVSFPVGGVPEVIRDGETGFLTAVGTVDALATRIREVVQCGPEALQRVAANACWEWEQNYTVEQYRKSLTDLMESLVSDWRARRGTEGRR